MADVVPKVSRALVERVKARSRISSISEDVDALVALAEAVLNAEEWGALCERDHHLDRYLDAIRSHLGKEERPGE